MPVYRAIVRGGKATDRKRLFSPHGNAKRLKGAEFCLIAQAELVLQHRRADVAVPVRLSVVKVDAQIFFPNWRAIARRRSSPEAPARSRSSSVRFDSDDRRIPSTAAILAIESRPSVMLSRMRPSRPLDPQFAARAANSGLCSLGRLGPGAVNAGGAICPFVPDLPAAIRGRYMDASPTLGHRRFGDVAARHRLDGITRLQPSSTIQS
jgi:hypothetical protein